MLVIREAQMEVFRRFFTEQFAASLAKHLLASFPAECADLGGGAAVARFVDQVLPRLDAHGIDREASVTMMAEVMLRFGMELETSPARGWALNVLAMRAVPADGRAQAIWERHEELTGGRSLRAGSGSD